MSGSSPAAAFTSRCRFWTRCRSILRALYTYVSDSEVVNTAEKKQYYVKTYAQWSIADPALFSLKLGSMTQRRKPAG